MLATAETKTGELAYFLMYVGVAVFFLFGALTPL
jgi:hypothetical protein